MSPSVARDDAGRCLHVREIMWSSDSSVLALWIVEKTAPASTGDKVQDCHLDTYGTMSSIHIRTAHDLSGYIYRMC